MKNVAPAIFPPRGIGDSKLGNKAVLDWVQEIATLTEPENIFWCDGSDREHEFLIAESLKQNVLIELNQDVLLKRLGDQKLMFPVRAVAPENVFGFSQCGDLLYPIEHGLIAEF